jgi:uncharacterized protein YbjT (DUF2867 family)
VGALFRNGEEVRLAVRHPGRVQVATGLTKAPEIVQADILDDISFGSAIGVADAVFNLVGILT